MNIVSTEIAEVPWTPRDVVLGFLLWLGFLLLELAVIILLGTAPQWLKSTGALLSEVGLIVPVWVFGVRQYAVPWRRLGLGGFRWQLLLMGCGGLLLFYGFNCCYSLLLALFSLQVQPGLVPAMSDPSRAIPLLLIAVLLAPTVEEIFFRGFMYAGLRSAIGPVWAALASAGAFSLAHLTPTAIVPFFLVGLFFAFLYEKGGSIWPSAIIHTLINLVGAGAAYFVANYSGPMPSL